MQEIIWGQITLNHIALACAFFALIVSFKANSLAKKSQKYTEETNKEVERISFYEKRTELLYEVDIHGTSLRDLWNTISERMILIKKTSNISFLEELAKDLSSVRNQETTNKELRSLILSIPEDDDITKMEKSLANLRGRNILTQEQIKSHEIEIQRYKLKNV